MSEEGWPEKRGSRRQGAQFSVYLTHSDKAALNRIAEYYGTTRVDALRTMIRFFEVHLNLARKPGERR